MRDDIMEISRQVYIAFVDDDETIREKPRFRGMPIRFKTPEIIEAFREYATLLITTNILNKYSQFYFRNGGDNVKRCVERYNKYKEENEPAMVLKTTQNAINRNRKQLTELFGSMVSDALKGQGLTEFRDRIQEVQQTGGYHKTTWADYLIKKPKISNNRKKNISDNELKETLQLIRCLSKSTIDNFTKQLESKTDEIEYLNYIMSSNSLSELDKRRKLHIMKLLNMQE